MGDRKVSGIKLVHSTNTYFGLGRKNREGEDENISYTVSYLYLPGIVS